MPATVAFEALHYAAFTLDTQGGNPAGIVKDDPSWTTDDRIHIADVLGYSETAFLHIPERPGDAFPVRFYSPRGEIAMCGHATLATAFSIADHLGAGVYGFLTGIGAVSVEVTRTSDDRQWYGELTGVPARSEPASAEDVTATLQALRWEEADLDGRYPAHVLQPGNNHLLLAATKESSLANLDYDFDHLRDVMSQRGWATVHLIHAVDRNTFKVRAPFPTGGLFEDAATGSAAVAFGSYLRSIGAITAPAQVTTYQGHYANRPCRLITNVPAEGSRITVAGTGRRLHKSR
ncbi:PhzF family phenazine biosynthesis protein [Microbacterium lacticum]